MNVTELVGKTLVKVEQVGDQEIFFTTNEGKRYRMYHWQDCCESVTIEDVVGDLADLVGEPILIAEEATSDENPDGVETDIWGTCTWTFYKFATRKGSVTIRWYGESNGYYSESVDFEEVSPRACP